MATQTAATITLSAQQQQALEQLHQFVTSSERLFVLEGYAGTGKTTLLQAFAAQLKEQGDDRVIAFSAFTNKATKVLAQMVTAWNLKIDCLTCCQLLGLKPQINQETGEQEFVPDKTQQNSFSAYALVVIDECSMVNQNLWELLLNEIAGLFTTTQILFVGDPAQLPPVNEVASQTFLSVANKAVLTEVVRYGGAIGILAESIRCNLNVPFLPRFRTDINPDKTEGTVIMSAAAWQQQLIRAFSSERSQADPDYVRAVAYTNKRVHGLNRSIRDAIFGQDVSRFVEGERLIAMSPVFGRPDEIVMQTSSECWVQSVDEDEVQQWRVWSLEVESDEGRRLTLPVLHESEFVRFQRKLQQLSELKRWKDFWRLKQQAFANVTYSYALTIHKSQGSTFQNVFVDLPNVMRNRKVRERNQLLYVAVTRAAQRLFIRDHSDR